MDFTTDVAQGYDTTSYGRSTFKMHFDATGKLIGTVTVDIFPLTADPVSSSAVPTATFGPTTFVGSRLK